MKPRIKRNCVAANYEGDNEAITEFTNGRRKQAGNRSGGLVNMHNRIDEHGTETLHVDLYRLDPGIVVSVDAEVSPYLSALTYITRNMRLLYAQNPDATVADYMTALRPLIEAKTDPRKVDVICIRDPDASNDYTILIDGAPTDAIPGAVVNIHDLDLGAREIDQEWLNDQLEFLTTDEPADVFQRTVLAGIAERHGLSMTGGETDTGEDDPERE